MDYGQNMHSDNVPAGQDFFTVGAGTNSDSLNNVEPENNFNLDNNLTNWESPSGQTEAPVNQEASLSQNESRSESSNTYIYREKAPELGQVANPEMAPNSSESNEMPIAETNATEDFDKNSIKTGEKLEKSGIREVDHAINTLSKTGDTAKFYNLAREMMITNIKNSYGNNANWGKDKAA